MSKIEFSMTEQELKEKIVNLLEEATGSWYEDEDGLFAEGRTPEEEDNAFKAHVADVLIAAGIGDVKEAEQRAKVAEKALRVLARKFVISVFPNGDWKELIEQLVSKVKKQAKKELQEERK